MATTEFSLVAIASATKKIKISTPTFSVVPSPRNGLLPRDAAFQKKVEDFKKQHEEMNDTIEEARKCAGGHGDEFSLQSESMQSDFLISGDGGFGFEQQVTSKLSPEQIARRNQDIAKRRADRQALEILSQDFQEDMAAQQNNAAQAQIPTSLPACSVLQCGFYSTNQAQQVIIPEPEVKMDEPKSRCKL